MTDPAQRHQAQQDAQVSAPGTGFPSLIEGLDHGHLHKPARTVAVGQEKRRADPVVDLAQLTPQELDDYIASLGRLMVRAHRLGTSGIARRLLELQVEARAARKARFPAHLASLEAEHLRRVEEGLGFFSSEHAIALGRAGGGA